MDRSHKLDAPNNEELRTIEQIEDHSGVSTLYREPGEKFEGDIVSAGEREKIMAEKYNTVSRGIWKSSLRIGLYVPYPIIGGVLLASALYLTVSWANAAVFLGFIVLALGIWGISSYFAYARIFKIFYKHGLRAGPFLVVMLISVLLASQAFYMLVAAQFATQSILFNVAVVSIFVILYSIAASFILLLVWGNPRINAILKIFISALVIITSGAFVAGVYLL